MSTPYDQPSRPLGPALAFVALGANLDDPVAQVRAAGRALADLPQSRLLRLSSLYRTAPVGIHGQPDFINAVAALETTLSAQQLLTALLDVETDFGRRRDYHHAPRTLDLDLLLYGEQISEAPHLTLPHPRLHQRAFVLAPLAEVSPSLTIPGRGRVDDLLAACTDQRIEMLRCVSLTS
jgi:2-amino-4-hydroxy-6-hydroxymethyldihydropteridine diphosphokinase